MGSPSTRSASYFREALEVSDGTAKAHIAHVYAKLGIHHKDDLLDYIADELRRGELSQKGLAPEKFQGQPLGGVRGFWQY